jgi:hypothetical protein
MSETAHDDGTREPAEPSMASTVNQFGWALYRQLAAMAAALGLAALLGRFWDIGWRGFLESVAGLWDAIVSPMMSSALHYIVTVPFGWIGLTVEAPPAVGDCIALGIIYVYGFFWDDFSDYVDMVIPLIFVPIWPVLLIGQFVAGLSETDPRKRVRSTVTLCSPLFYLALVLALNSWVMPTIS